MYSLTVLDKMSLRRRWDYARFCDEIHKRPDIDFSFVQPHHVTSVKSNIPLRCRKCGYHWCAKVVHIFLGKQSGCLRCTGQIKWTLQRLLTEGAQRWPWADFSRVREEDVVNSKSLVIIGCKVCGKYHEKRINDLVTGYGCPTCGKCERWSIERFATELYPRFQHRYNFSEVLPGDVTNTKSPFWITSFECGHRWQSCVAKLLKDYGCPECSITKQWTYDELILGMQQTRPDIDTSLIKREDVVGCRSILTWKCADTECAYVWQTQLFSLVNGNTGCPRCSGCEQRTYDRFMEEMQGRDDVDLSLITRDHDFRGKSKLPFICKKCNGTYEAEAYRTIQRVSRCPCSQVKSQGEENVTTIFTQYNVPFEREVILPSLPRKRYDFRFVYNNRQYLLEFDGEQHFTYNDFHHRDEAHFRERQSVDILKTQHAYQNNYFLIRIDYTQIDNIQHHLHAAMTSPNTEVRYLSNPEMYAYLFAAPASTPPSKEEITA
jgi:hypothetical protein